MKGPKMNKRSGLRSFSAFIIVMCALVSFFSLPPAGRCTATGEYDVNFDIVVIGDKDALPAGKSLPYFLSSLLKPVEGWNPKDVESPAVPRLSFLPAPAAKDEAPVVIWPEKSVRANDQSEGVVSRLFGGKPSPKAIGDELTGKLFTGRLGLPGDFFKETQLPGQDPWVDLGDTIDRLKGQSRSLIMVCFSPDKVRQHMETQVNIAGENVPAYADAGKATSAIKNFLRESMVDNALGTPKVIIVLNGAQNSSAPAPGVSAGDEETILRLVGSNTLGEKMIPLLAERFMKQELKATGVQQFEDPSDKELIDVVGEIGGKKQRISITARGSGDAFNNKIGLTAQAPCDIGMASRPIKDAEKTALGQRYGQWETVRGPKPGEGTEHVVAMDGLAVVVHPSNPIKRITLDTVRRIFSKEITDWSQVHPEIKHGKSGPIRVLCRAVPSGTRDFFIAKVKPSSRLDEAEQIISSSELAGKISADPNSISFVSESYIDSGRVKSLDVSASDGLDQVVSPDRDSIRSEQYPLSRPLFLYTAAAPAKAGMVGRFIRFALNETVQDKVIDKQARLISEIGTRYELISTAKRQDPVREDVILRLDGSDAIGEELGPKLAKRYLSEIKAVDISEDKSLTEHTPEGDVPIIRVSGTIDGSRKAIEIKARKSSFGFTSLADGSCDIAMSSDEISPAQISLLEREGLNGMSGGHSQFVVGYDAVSVIVNDSNPVRSLSLNQVKAIFTGAVVNWKEVGGKDQPITVYSRPEGSGTRHFFTNRALNQKDITDKARIKVRNSDIAAAVGVDLGGVGFLPFAETQNSTLVGLGEGSERYEPNAFTVVKRNLYPIRRQLYLYIPPTQQNLKESQAKNYARAKDFVKMAQDLGKGQKDVASARFFPILVLPNQNDRSPTNNLITKVNFDFNAAKLDVDSENLINNTLYKFVQENPSWQNRALLVIGFSDIIGSDQACEAKAHQRAETVVKFLRQKGLMVVDARSGGKSNLGGLVTGASKALLREDRRAEIWVGQ